MICMYIHMLLITRSIDVDLYVYIYVCIRCMYMY